MGYESKIYVVHKSSISSVREWKKKWAQKIAMIDMGKCYMLSDILRNKPATDCYIYEDDGNTPILEDCYGKPLTETPLHEAVQIVKNVIAKTPYEYWMYNVLLATLQSVYEFAGNDEDFVILHFGH